LIELGVYIVDVVFQVPYRVRLMSWSGVFAGKVIYDSLGLAGTPLTEGGLFRVSPVYPAEGGYAPASGFLAPGERYRFRAVFWGRGGEVPASLLARGFVTGLGFNQGILVESIDMREERLRAPSPEPLSENDDSQAVAATVIVRHNATFYRFHGAVVSYPSPWRLIASIARRLSTATRQDYRPLARSLQPCLELAVDNTKKTRIRLTHGKEVKIFMGEARYHLVCSQKLADRVRQLLNTATVLGVGGSPGLGLGEVQAISIEPPRHQLPAPVEPWAEEDWRE